MSPKKSEKPLVEYHEVTPQMAANWLSAVPAYQRKIDERQVNKLVMAIHKGEWRVNGATIVFNEKGDLIDGQHRLQAILKSGKTCGCLVATNIAKDELTFASLGDVKPRATADFIRSKNPYSVAAVLRILWFLEQGLLYQGIRAKGAASSKFPSSPPVAELVKLAKHHAPEIEKIIQPLAPAVKITRSGSWVPFLMYYFILKRPKAEAKKVSEFFSRVADGVGLTAKSPVLHLRKRCMEQGPGLLMLPQIVRMALVLKALNFYLDDVQIDRLTWSPDREPFPTLRGYEQPEQ